MTRLPALLVVLWCLVPLTGCLRRMPTEKERAVATARYDLGIEAQKNGDHQGAYREFSEALRLDPYFPEAHFAMGVLYQFGFKRPDDAEKSYREALKIRANYSEAKVNLGTLFLEKGRYDEAIKLFDEALNDMAYRTPYIAQGNRGWALYQKGDVTGAVDALQGAVTTNPGYCMGYRQLGTIYEKQGQDENACREYTRYREACPDVGDAYFREGVCQAKLGKADEARTALAGCVAKSSGSLKDDCQRLLEQLQ